MTCDLIDFAGLLAALLDFGAALCLARRLAVGHSEPSLGIRVVHMVKVFVRNMAQYGTTLFC